jgi:hypothetical protein
MINLQPTTGNLRDHRVNTDILPKAASPFWKSRPFFPQNLFFLSSPRFNSLRKVELFAQRATEKSKPRIDRLSIVAYKPLIAQPRDRLVS